MSREDLLGRLRATRKLSRDLCRPLKAEDYRIQSMPDVSPPWWNLGHTTWFFAKNVLEPHGRYEAADARYEYVLNSYYELHGKRVPRAERGLQSRPTTDEILAFRESVDQRLERLLQEAPEDEWADLAFLVTTGIHHEQQHQELFVTEIKHILGSNAPELRQPYSDGSSVESAPRGELQELDQVAFEGGLDDFGNREAGWCFDNEVPVHRGWLEPYALATRLVSNGEFLDFVADGGYEEPLLWLANGWAWVNEEGWRRPLYWEGEQDDCRLWTLGGPVPLPLHEPVSHVSFYEADAFARWKAHHDEEWRGSRLPTEREWEHAARSAGFDVAAGNFLEDGLFGPRACNGAQGLAQAAGDLWEWTSSHYEPYPGYVPFDGALTEYNGKFMDNQRVLRGGSCATPRAHIRVSYRNFWAPETRFQFSGLRLARSLEDRRA
jgi:ergothioneine biosynthesis protein EgtB